MVRGRSWAGRGERRCRWEVPAGSARVRKQGGWTERRIGERWQSSREGGRGEAGRAQPAVRMVGRVGWRHVWRRGSDHRQEWWGSGEAGGRGDRVTQRTEPRAVHNQDPEPHSPGTRALRLAASCASSPEERKRKTLLTVRGTQAKSIPSRAEITSSYLLPTHPRGPSQLLLCRPSPALLPPPSQGLSSSTGPQYRTGVDRPSPRLRCRPRRAPGRWLPAVCRREVVRPSLLHPPQSLTLCSRIVQRNRPITVLTVYTGDPSHKVCPSRIQKRSAPSSPLR